VEWKEPAAGYWVPHAIVLEKQQVRLEDGSTMRLSGVDGVPEARSQAGELYGFNRLSTLTLMAAHDIAKVAQNFGQEDDITVLTLALAPN
jgi:hypothetical protein